MSLDEESNFNKIYTLEIIPDLMEFLENRRKKPGQKCTHTSLRGGSFHIPDYELEIFHLTYHSTCANNKQQFPALTEMKKEYSPVMIDLDLKFNKKFTERLLTKNHREEIVKLFSDYLEDPNYIYMQRENPYLTDDEKNPIVKDGIHIAFPDSIKNVEYQVEMREQLMPELENILSDLPIINNIEDIYDKSVPSGAAPWLLYFSAKPGMRPYRLTKSYKSYKDDGVGLINALSIRMNGYDSYQTINDDEEPPRNSIIIKDNRKKKKERVSGQSLNREIPLDSEEGMQICALVDQVRHNFPQHDLNVTKIKQCGGHVFVGTGDHFCPFIDRDHKRKSASMYIDISEQGLCLRCYDSDCHDQKWPTKHIPIPKDSPVFNMFKDVTFQQHNYYYNKDEEDELIDFKEDNVQAVDDPETNEVLLKSLNGTHYDIAMLIYMMNKDKYRCSALKSARWFEYKKHLWEQDETGIRTFISNDLETVYQKVLKYYKKHVEVEEYSKKRKVISDLIKKIKTTTFKNNIMSECSEIFYSKDKQFIINLNSNTHLIGFKNGVYDLSQQKFRKGKPTDYISFCVGYDFPKKRKKIHIHIKDVNSFLEQVFPVESVRRYVLKLMASCLNGEITDELFHIFTGSGANGKSKFIDLNTITFGEYGFRLSISLLTQKRAASNAACPELADKQGKRLGIFQEPDKGDEIKVGIMKEYTGGDIITVRQLYGQQFEFKPQFKLILCCNDLPKIPSTDGGTWRRMRVIEFVSKFVDHPNPDVPYQFPIDRSLKDKMKEWKEAYMLVLLDHYKLYVEEGLEPPEEITKFTKMYQEESDSLQDYFINYIKINEKSYLTLTNIYSNYKDWCKLNSTKCINSREFKKELEKRFGSNENIRDPSKRGRCWNLEFIEQ